MDIRKGLNSVSSSVPEISKDKNHAKTARLLSMLFMGAGQFYNRQYGKGIFFAAIEALSLLFLPFFYWGIWGLVTLGEVKSHIVKGRMVQGDHSIFLLIEGIITLLLIITIVLFYIGNVKDASTVGALRDKGKKVNSLPETLRNVWENGYPYLLLSPGIVFITFLTILPLLFGILIAFTNYSSPKHIPPGNLVDWVGFQTFIEIFNLKTWSGTFYGVAAWTVIWAVLATFTTFFGGLIVALLINQKGIRFKAFWRTMLIIPWAIPQFISLLIMRNMFNGEFGPINQYLQLIGLSAVPWLSDPYWAKVTIVMVNAWVGIPVSMVLTSGVITGISKDLYEAAEVDGATAWQKFSKITVPMVLFATAPLLILFFAGNINNFNLIYLLTDGNPVNPAYRFAGSTDILITWIYKMTLDQNQYNIASAVSIIIFIVIASVSIWNFRRTRSFKEEDMIQ